MLVFSHTYLIYCGHFLLIIYTYIYVCDIIQNMHDFTSLFEFAKVISLKLASRLTYCTCLWHWRTGVQVCVKGKNLEPQFLTHFMPFLSKGQFRISFLHHCIHASGYLSSTTMIKGQYANQSSCSMFFISIGMPWNLLAHFGPSVHWNLVSLLSQVEAIQHNTKSECCGGTRCSSNTCLRCDSLLKNNNYALLLPQKSHTIVSTAGARTTAAAADPLATACCYQSSKIRHLPVLLQVFLLLSPDYPFHRGE